MQDKHESSLYSLQQTLTTPSHISSLTLGHAGHLFVGSDDGSLRIYDLSSYKVLKAVRGLGGEVSSIVCIKRAGSELRDAWIACGRRIVHFQMDSSKMIQTIDDALFTIDMGETDEDVLNELSLNIDKTHLAFSMDSGNVGVLDLSTKIAKKMDVKHETVCGCVKFIPDRPHEIVSGGYDTSLIHFDHTQGNLLSRCKMEPHTPDGGMTLSPPFVMSMAMSPTGVLAAGTADGRLWLGFGGERASGLGKKKKKWQGLNEEDTMMTKVAEGPIVAMAFSDARTFTISTLLGMITQYELIHDKKESVILKQVWKTQSKGLEKVNAMLTGDKRIIVGGFSSKGRGIIEIWKSGDPAKRNDENNKFSELT